MNAIKLSFAAIAITTIATITNAGESCGVIGNPCKKLSEGKPACEMLAGEWNEERNCCNISKN